MYSSAFEAELSSTKVKLRSYELIHLLSWRKGLGKKKSVLVVKVVLRVSLQDINGSLHLSPKVSPKVTYVSMCVWSFASLGCTLGWVSSHSAWFRPFPWWLLWAGDFQVTQSLTVKRHIHAYTHALRQRMSFRSPLYSSFICLIASLQLDVAQGFKHSHIFSEMCMHVHVSTNTHTHTHTHSSLLTQACLSLMLLAVLWRSEGRRQVSLITTQATGSLDLSVSLSEY